MGIYTASRNYWPCEIMKCVILAHLSYFYWLSLIYISMMWPVIICCAMQAFTNITWIPWLSKHIDGLVQERRNSSLLAMEIHLSCTNLWIWPVKWEIKLLIHSQTSMVTPLNFWEWIKNFIPCCIMDKITCSCWGKWKAAQVSLSCILISHTWSYASLDNHIDPECFSVISWKLSLLH